MDKKLRNVFIRQIHQIEQSRKITIRTENRTVNPIKTVIFEDTKDSVEQNKNDRKDLVIYLTINLRYFRKGIICFLRDARLLTKKQMPHFQAKTLLI